MFALLGSIALCAVGVGFMLIFPAVAYFGPKMFRSPKDKR